MKIPCRFRFPGDRLKADVTKEGDIIGFVRDDKECVTLAVIQHNDSIYDTPLDHVKIKTSKE